jgi:post-segregation antitoxin (ccd killing protein)
VLIGFGGNGYGTAIRRTGQSLFYMGETNLKNKILAIDIDEELMNRCLVLTVNESREQTQAIHAMQRQQQTLEGLLQNEDRKQLIQLHRNAQRLLRPLLVANPFAEQLTFIDDKTRTRRDHMKYLTLIRSIALLHQYQREVKTVAHNGQALEYIEVTLADIEIANQLAHEVLGRTLEELPPQTYMLLKHIKAMVSMACKKQEMEQKDYRFSRRDIREHTGWSDGQLKIHCSRLTDLEYLLVHRGGRGQSIVVSLNKLCSLALARVALCSARQGQALRVLRSCLTAQP